VVTDEFRDIGGEVETVARPPRSEHCAGPLLAVNAKRCFPCNLKWNFPRRAHAGTQPQELGVAEARCLLHLNAVADCEALRQSRQVTAQDKGKW